MRSKTLHAVDLFSGAGGLSLGLSMAGWSLDTSIEFNEVAVETHRINMPNVSHICDDVRGVNFKQFKGIDLIAGGPPCQPFSVSGKQLGSNDTRDMIPQFIRAVKESRPKAFLMENVAGLTTKKFMPYLQQQIEELVQLKYKVQWVVLDAADYGVPQRRLRLFVIGTLKEYSFNFPEATHGKDKLAYVTVKEALKGTPKDSPNTAKVVYAKNPILRKSPYAGMLLNGQGRPLNMNGISHTIPASAGGNRTHILDPKGVLKKYHAYLLQGGKPLSGEVEGCKRLTVNQSARLQTFPDWFKFEGTKSQRYAQIGNAVPPTLAAAVAAKLYESILA